MSMGLSELPIKSNRLETRADVQEAVRQLCEPLRPYYSPGCARVGLGYSGANYPYKTSLMESFARPMWGIVPLLAGGGDYDLWQSCVEGVKNGTNPEHPEYWGDLGETDQLAVEMPPIALAFAIMPEKIWDVLDDQQKQNVVSWLDQINHNGVPDCNWNFFIVLVNVALLKLGVKYNKENLQRFLDRIDDFYLGDGWYSDGYKRDQRDYYIPFAMHFYGMIYAGLMEDVDPERCAVYRDRAKLFANDFIHWFASDGAAIPFGRSLTYRFAQGAFWGSLAFGKVEGLDWSVIKGLYLRHLRWWFDKPIFSQDGLLTVGYGYPNLLMSETYNAPGSPYWSFKAFLPLALSEDHPFWRADEKPLPNLQRPSVQKHPYMIISSNESGSHVYALTAGQWMAKIDPIHQDAKYSKFAYSSAFAFSVPRQSYGLKEGAYDSMLALGEGDGFYRTRRKCEYFKIEDNSVFSIWKPYPDVVVETWLIPAGSWHVRVHKINTGRHLETAEGAFAIPCESPDGVLDLQNLIDDHGIALKSFNCLSGVVNLLGDRAVEVVETMANTNLMSPKTAIPTLTGSIGKGKHFFVTAVLGDTEVENSEQLWLNRPSINIADSRLFVSSANQSKPIFETDIFTAAR